jgi:hypothetical protein
MSRIEEASNELLKYFNRKFFIKEVLFDIKQDEKSNGFHFGTGKAIRETLSNLGFDDVKDDYLEILKLVYDKAGIK